MKYIIIIIISFWNKNKHTNLRRIIGLCKYDISIKYICNKLLNVFVIFFVEFHQK